MAPYWLLWLVVALLPDKKITPETFAFVATTVLLPIIVPLVITTPIWFIFRRSQRVASTVFIIALLFYMVPEYSSILRGGAGAKLKGNGEPTRMEKIENELNSLPVFITLKQYDPAAYNAILADVKGSIKNGVNDKVVFAQVRGKILALAETRMPHASDSALVNFIGVTVREMREFAKHEPDLCYKFLFPQKYGAADPSKYLSQDLIAEDMAALDEVIKTSSEKPQSIPSLDEVSSDLQLVFGTLQEKYGNKIQMLQALHDPSVNKLEACNMLAEMHERVLQLPAKRNTNLLRYLLSQS